MYTCQNCGVTAETASDLCKPDTENYVRKFCGTPTDQICNEKQGMMKFKCDYCGSWAVDADHLCDPRHIKA